MKNKIKKLNRKIPRKEAGRKVTINELALMIGKGFAGVDAKFAQVNERFTQMDERFDRMDERFDRMEMKLDSLERRIFAIEDILTVHGKDIAEIKDVLIEHGKDIKEIKTELRTLKKVDNGNSDKIFGLEQRVKVLEVKVG